ncbi:putative phage abortive infection protein [Methylobacterium gnaphalii]|uniref:Uncharacterized protein n=1 Tax=Methylobacterium gnaphalii TaxID=1010610 RepID=A0A512JJW2_9HYPH|nr:putative phage abortive infection protein [Methylobacterium gnaphalii]GEP10256.1 hypothetical protein MGN01_21010 [Methylobacterium gnaphalii]
METQLDAIAKQNFEATLFQMLSLHSANVNELRGFDGNRLPISGRAVLAHYVTELSRTYANPAIKGYDPTDLNLWASVYRDFWNSHRDALGHYFRLLYNMIRFLETKTPRVGEATNKTARIEYMRIIRAQLSDAELVLIFYNCFSEHGERLLQYARNYNLFDNLDENLLFNGSHREKLRELKR